MVKNKRRQDGQNREYEEETVNDLAVAASFAMQQPLSISVTTANLDETPNKPDPVITEELSNVKDTVNDLVVATSFAIQQPLSTGVTTANLDETPNKPDPVITEELTEFMKTDDDQKDLTKSEKIVELQDKSIELKEIDNMHREKEENKDEEEEEEEEKEKEKIDDSDDESVVNLSESLVKMEQEETKTPKQTLKTEHELDINKCSLDDLSKQLNLDLTVDEEKEKEQLHHAHLIPAGNVKSHLVQDRIIIVESNCQDALEEGCLFVMKVDNEILNNTDANDTTKKEILIPIARIFEVFGPILKPLYSLRLPTVRQNESSKKKNLDSSQQSNDESTTNDDTKIKSDDTTSKKEEEENKNNSKKSDPWSSSGIYTQILKKNPNLIVYLDQKDRKIINTDTILRASGKGSDASNVFDEEVVNTNELDFSDDEEERQFKQQRRKKKNNNNNNNNNNAAKRPPRRWNAPDPRQQMQNVSYPHQPQMVQSWTNNNAPMGSYNNPPQIMVPPPPYTYASQNYGPPNLHNNMMYSVPPPTMHHVPPPPLSTQLPNNNYPTNPNYNIQPPSDPRKKEEDTVYYNYS